jgi:predicted  nucleic acid-binding Zn-ribbon protein
MDLDEIKTRLKISENERYEIKRAVRNIHEQLKDFSQMLQGMVSEITSMREEIENALDGSLADLTKEDSIRNVESET